MAKFDTALGGASASFLAAVLLLTAVSPFWVGHAAPDRSRAPAPVLAPSGLSGPPSAVSPRTVVRPSVGASSLDSVASASSLTPVPPATPLNTLDLIHRTVAPGLGTPDPGTDPQQVAVDVPDSRLFVATGGGAVAVLDQYSERLLDTIPTGGALSGIAYDAANDEVYAAQINSGRVIVIDAQHDTILGMVFVGSRPASATFDPVNGQVYITNTGSSSVSAIDGTSNAVVASIRVDGGPVSATVDLQDGDLFVACASGNAVDVIDGSTDRVIAHTDEQGTPRGVLYVPSTGAIYVTVYIPGLPDQYVGSVQVLNGTGAYSAAVNPVGPCPPWGLAYDDYTGEVFVDEPGCSFGSSAVYVLDPGTNEVVANITAGLGAYPDSIAYDAQNAMLYLPDSPFPVGTLSLLDGSHRKVVGTVATGVGPSGVAVDPSVGAIYVAEWGAGVVAVVDASHYLVSTTIPVGKGPTELVIDPADHRLYVAVSGAGLVALIDTRTDRVVASQSLREPPGGLCFDPTNGELYAAVSGANAVVALNGSTLSVRTTIAVGVGPESLVYDPSENLLFVTNAGPPPVGAGAPANLTVIDPSTDRSIDSIPIGTGGAVGIGFDARDDLLFAPVMASGVISIIDPTTYQRTRILTVPVTSLGPTADVTYDLANNELVVAYGDQLLFLQCGTATVLGEVAVGSGAHGVLWSSAEDRVFATAAGSGTLVVLQPTVYSQSAYDVHFEESGLPSGTTWSVTLNGAWLTSQAATITFTVLEGRYRYSVASVPGFAASPSAGTVTVSSSGLLVSVLFHPITYRVTFAEEGLPGGVPWTVHCGGAVYNSTASSVELNVPNGSYAFSIDPVQVGTKGSLDPSPSTGVLLVLGEDVLQNVSFAYRYGPPPWILRFVPDLARVLVNTTVSLTVAVRGGYGTLHYTYMGLPWGCESQDVEVLECTPQTNGTYELEAVVTDAVGRSALALTNLTVVAVPSPPGGEGGSGSWMTWLASRPAGAWIVLAEAVALACIAFLPFHRRWRRPPPEWGPGFRRRPTPPGPVRSGSRDARASSFRDRSRSRPRAGPPNGRISHRHRETVAPPRRPPGPPASGPHLGPAAPGAAMPPS